jgi:predicted ATP-dependent endonuclease of OLD family
MIKKIRIIKKSKTIPKDFELELEQITVITGKNNSGKTNFVEAINSREKETQKLNKVEFIDEGGNILEIEPEIIYIKAENIKPSEDALKSTAKTTWLVENLAKLFLNAGFGVKLDRDDREKIEEILEDIKNKANENLKSFTGKESHKIDISKKGAEMESQLIIQTLIDKIKIDEDGEMRDLNHLGQGMQRIIVVSVLKAYLDILVEGGNCVDKETLIIIEEPEIYLHPELKRSLNSTLEKIANEEKHQVLITTHDPYFAFKNFNGDNKKIISFEKKDNLTKIEENIINGVEDELLFIFLYNLSEKTKGNIRIIDTFDGFSNRKFFDRSGGNDVNFLTYIRDQIHHSGTNSKTIGMISEDDLDNLDLSEKNYYTEKELSKAIKKMCKIINE